MAGFFFRDRVDPDPQAMLIKDRSPAESAEVLGRASAVASSVATWSAADLEPPLRALADEAGLSAGQLFGAMRMAITGQAVALPFRSMEIIGRDLP
jgi:glutamyl-tRNA synthetase